MRLRQDMQNLIQIHFIAFCQKITISVSMRLWKDMPKSDSNPFKCVFAEKKNYYYLKEIFTFQYVYDNICKNLIRIRFNASWPYICFNAFTPICLKNLIQISLNALLPMRKILLEKYTRFNAFIPIYAKIWFRSI